MYEKVKKLTFKPEENRIVAVCAASNVAPTYYRECEYGAGDKYSYEEKVFQLFRSILEGYLKLNASVSVIVKRLDSLGKKLLAYAQKNKAVDIGYTMDRFYGLNCEDDLYNVIAQELASRFLGKAAPEQDAFRAVDACLRDAEAKYAEAEKACKEKKYILVTCAWQSSKHLGKDVLVAKDGDKEVLYLAESRNYNNHGRLDNSDGTAVCYGEYSYAKAVELGA